MTNHLLRERMQIRGRALAEFLNVAPSPARKRLVRLRDCCLRLQEQLDWVVENPKGHVSHTFLLPLREGKPSEHAWYAHWPNNKKVWGLLRETDRLLARYTYRRNVPFIFPVRPGEWPSVPMEAQASEKSERKETLAADMLLSLAEWRALDWVRTCPVCKRWFVRSRRDQVFCGQQCLQKHFVEQRNPEEQAAYMRAYRKAKKTREQHQEKLWIKQGVRHARN